MKSPREFFSNFGRVFAIGLFCVSCVTPGGGTTPGKVTPGKTDPGKTEPGKTDPGKTDPGKTDPGKTDPGKTSPPRPVTFHPGGIVIPGELPGPGGPRKPGAATEPGQGPWSLIRYIKSRRGLNMRSGPSISGRRLQVIPYNSRVLVLETKKKLLNLGGRAGRWARIQYGTVFGWVFDAYLSEEKGPDVLDAAGLRALYKSLSFRARLHTDDAGVGRVIGRLRKKAGTEKTIVDTLRRTCGKGKLDGSMDFRDEALVFYVKYRWCKVDPGNEIRVSCVNCDMYRYECRLPGGRLNEHTRAGGTSFEKKINCKLTAKTFCPKSCPL